MAAWLRVLGNVRGLHGLRHLGRVLRVARDDDRLVVSEPFTDLPGAWHEIPESTALTVLPGGAHELRAFRSLTPDAIA